MSDDKADVTGGASAAPGGQANSYDPSKRRRFKESFSPTGQPAGRPKGSRNRKTIVREVANEMHTVVDGGKRRSYSTLELILLKLRNMALAGRNAQAVSEFHRFVEVYQPESRDSNVGYLVVPTPLSPEAWIARAEEENKTRMPPAGLAQRKPNTPTE